MIHSQIRRPVVTVTLLIAGLTSFAVLAAKSKAPAHAETSWLTHPAPPKGLSLNPALRFPEQELSGQYYLGDGLGVNCSLTLEPTHRFAFAWHGCMGLYDQNQGVWSLEGDTLVVKPKKPNKREGFEGMNLRFIPVQWGKRGYLVDENEMPGFCAAAHTEPPSSDNLH